MTFETDALSMLRGFPGVGSVSVSSPRGTFCAIFENLYFGDGDPPVETSRPQLQARSSDVQRLDLRAGVVLTIGADRYVLRAIQPDGTGMTLLGLEAA